MLEPVEKSLAAALRYAAEAERWDIVIALARQLAELRRDGAGPAVRVVEKPKSDDAGLASP
jgi:hypothetical protein